jgi:steroid delta-isomerase-like uncharacterized protein
MTTTDVTLEAGVDLDWLAAFAIDYLAAWNSHDPDRLLALMSEDIVYDDTAWPTQMHGHAGVRPFLESVWRATPDLVFELVEGPYLVPGKPKAAFHWRGTATFTGPLEPPGFAPTGGRAVFEGVDFHEYRDGKLARLRIVFDNMDVARKLGLLPAAGSRADRAGATAQRLAMRLRSLRRP